MPGIVGLVTKMPRDWAEAQLNIMVGSIRHEPFYESGMFIDESLGVYVGWAERKGSFASGMPVSNASRSISLIFSGEEFPDPKIRETAKTQGGASCGCALAYLIQLYQSESSFPESLNGRFHGIVADREKGAAVLFNDRYGLHRVYYRQSADTFYFASEAKAILEVQSEARSADPRGLGEFVACGCVMEDRTLFQGLQVLPGGAAWTFRNGALERKDKYFDPKDWENQPALDAETYYQQLREVFLRNLPRYFNGRERVGMSLTGGLDTRMIMAAHAAAPGSLPCYSFGGMFRECEDVKLARRIARACGQPYEVISVGTEFLSKFSRYAERTVYLTDGCTDVSHSPDLFANERASAIAPVRMTGNYGSEILRRTRAFKPVFSSTELYNPDFLGHVHTAKETYNRLIQGHPLTFAAFRQAPWHHYGLLALEQTQLAIRSPFLDNQLVRTVFRAPQATLANANVSLQLIADSNPSLSRIRTDRGLAGANNGLRAAVSRKFLNFTAKAEYAYDYGMPHSLARIDHFLGRLHLEQLFLGRHKFYHFRIWYRDFLRTYVQEMLLDSRTLSRPYLQPQTVRNMVEGHIKGQRNYTLEINKLLTLELVHRLLIDPSRP